MKIISLKAENVKRLKAVEIVPEGNTVIVSGRNGQGKTSVLDSIWLALGGGNAAKDSQTSQPIRDGEKKANVSLDLGDIKVTRSWTATGGMTLKVEGKDGAVYKSPQGLLDGMTGKLSFDPLAFSRMVPEEQRKTLIGLVDLGFDPDEMERKIKGVYDERTAVNRDLKALEARISGMAAIDPSLPAEEVSLTELLEEAKEAAQHISDNKRMRSDLVSMRTKAETMQRELKTLREELERKEKKFQTTVEAGRLLASAVEILEDPDLEAINAKIGNIEEVNRKIREANQAKALMSEAEALRRAADENTAALEEMREQKRNALAAAKFPIDGLGFDEVGVTFRGVPFAQCSSAERMKVSLSIAAALNPTIRVIRVNDGSLLDSESMAEVERMAAERDMQVWVERVDETGKVGIVIEDGEILAKNAKPAAHVPDAPHDEGMDLFR